LRELILGAYDSLRYADHFEFLGVPRAARDAEVKDAYTRLVRVLHPDACRDPAVADLGPERSAVFARLCQAYETLRSPAARAAYERDVAPVKRRPSLPPAGAPAVAPAAPQPTTPPAPRPDAAPPQPELTRPSLPDAAQALDQAAVLLRQEKFWDLIQLLEPRIPRLDTRARHRAQVLLAQAYLKNPNWSKRAEATLQAVVAEDPRHVDAHFLLAGLYLKTRLEARATAMFRKVLTLQPDHAGAAAGLKALLGARGRPLPLPFLKRA
jgi:curved DNA-binding protein CbpA